MFEVIFAFLPMPSGYVFSGIGLDFAVMAFAGIFVLRRQGFKFVISDRNRDFLVLFCYVIFKEVLIVFFGESDSSQSFHRLIQIVAYIIFFLILLQRSFNHEKFYKGLKYAGILYTTGLIYHLVIIYVFGMPAKGISVIPGFEFSNENWLDRPRSFFSEPAALAQAMLPLLFYSLHRKDYKWSLIATFSIFMSTSTAGVLLAAILWFIEFIMITKRNKHKVLVSMLLVIVGVLLIRTGMADETILAVKNRLLGGGSTSVRVFLGFEVVGTMSPAQYITGLLYNKPYDYTIQNIELFASDSIARRWIGFGEGQFFINAICSLIFRYGILGSILYFRIYKGKLFNKGYAGRALAIMTVIEMFGDSMLFNSYYFYIMLILTYLTQREREIAYESITYRVRIRQSDA